MTASDGALTLYGLGTTTTVRVAEDRRAEVTDAVRRAWSRCLQPRPGCALPTEDVPADAGAVASDLEPMLQSLTQQVTRAKIAAQTGRLFMMHAGALADPATGAAVAFAARGGTGKTTLMRTLGTRYGYLTDETVAVDAAGLVHPYEKPLSVRLRPRETRKGELSPDDLCLLPAPASARLRRIVLLDRNDGHGGVPTLTELGLADALVALAPETSALSALPRPLHWLADLLDGLLPTVRLRYADAASVADLMPSLLDAA